MALNLTPQLNGAIPGFSRNTAAASDLIRQLMAGNLTTGERRSIYDSGAERATLGGMPGASGAGGSLFANADLRNIGQASGQRQQQGFQDLLSMLQGYSGTVVPTAGQELQNNQFNQDLGFRNKQADRTFGLQSDENQRSWLKYQKDYGPKEYSNTEIRPNGSRILRYQDYF